MTWNLITGLFATLIGVVYGWSAWSLPRATFGSPTGHIVYPVLLGILMTVLGLALVISELVKKGPKNAADSPKFGAMTRHGREILITVAASIVYALLFVPLGYVFSTMLYLGAILFLVNGKVKVARTIIVAVLFSVLIYILFSVLLGVQLPRMPILDI